MSLPHFEAALALVVSWRRDYETASTWRPRFMKDNISTATFVDQVKQQLEFLRDPDYTYSALHVYVAGVPEPWEFGPDDDFDFNEDSAFLIVRRGPTDEDNNDNVDVPESVFHLNAIVATELV